MVSAVYVVPVATNVLAAAVAFAVGLRLARHPAEGANGRAVRRFSVWWMGLAAFISANQIASALGILGVDAAALYAALVYLSFIALAAALWGLVSYVLYLFTGRRAVFMLVTLAYLVQLAAVVAWMASLGPRGILLTEGGTQTDFARQPSPTEGAIFALFLLLPPIAASVALFTLRFRTKDPTARYRATAMGVGIFVWFFAAILITSAGKPTPATTIGGPLLGTLCMFYILSAYFPPRWLQARGVQPFGLTPARREKPDAAKSEELMRRVRELV